MMWGTRVGWRRTRAVGLVFAMVGAVLAVGTGPANASVCSDFPYAGESGMVNSACRENTIDPGIGNLLDRPTLLSGAANQLLNSRGFSDQWIWYAPEVTRTFHQADNTQWSFCNTYEPANSDPDEFTTAGFVCDGPLPLGFTEVTSSFNTNSVALRVYQYGGGFVSRACGNFSNTDPSDPVPTIIGDKFRDDDKDGVWDGGEPARAGVTFRLTRLTSDFGGPGQGIGQSWTTTTNSNGRFSFSMNGRGPGRYRVEEVLPAGWTGTNSTARTVDVDPGVGDKVHDAGDFGNIPLKPVVDGGTYVVYEGDTVHMDDGSATSPGGFPLTIDWDPDDKLIADANTVTPVFDGIDDAVDVLTMTATDPFGQAMSADSEVTTLNRVPEFDLGAPPTIDEDDTFTRVGLPYSDPGRLDTHTATVDYGDGSGVRPLALNPLPTPPGGPANGTFDLLHQYLDDDPTGTPQDTYTITVTITDDDHDVSDPDPANWVLGETVETLTVTVNNLDPATDPGPDETIDENDTFVRTGLTYGDVGTLDTHVGTVDYDDGDGPQPLSLTPTGPGSGTYDLSHQYLDDNPTGTPEDDRTITVTISDDDTGEAVEPITLTVKNVDPTTEVGPDETISEGDTFTRTLSYDDIGSLDTHQAWVDYDDHGSPGGAGWEPLTLDPITKSYTLEHLYEDDDPTATPQDDYTVRVRIEDDDTGVVEDSLTLTVLDVAPDLTITAPTVDQLYQAPATVNLVAPFTDPGVRDTFICSIDWDEGPATNSPPAPPTEFAAPFAGTAGNCDATNVFQTAGVYTIRVMVTDDDTLFDVEEITIVVVDPGAGFVTGGGWFDSPAGALVDDPAAAGPARFGFVSKYRPNNPLPQGNTEFQFQAGDINFHAGDYDWLVVTGNGERSQFTGEGRINGVDGYGFRLTAYDLGEPGSGTDKIRLKIWDLSSGDLVYDNRPGLPDDVDRADPQLITQGNIQIHARPAPAVFFDAFEDADVLSGSTGVAVGSNDAATGEYLEPEGDCATMVAPVQSVWFEWTAPSSQRVQFDTGGSDFDTQLNVYTGSSVDALSEVGCNDESTAAVAGESAVAFDASAGTTYHVRVDGAGVAAGDFTLNWAPLPTVVPGGVAVVEGDSGTTTASLPLTLSAPSTVPVTVEFTTFDIPGNPGAGHAGEDYVATAGTVVFAPGETSKTVDVEIIGDMVYEPGLLFGADWGVMAYTGVTNARFGPGLFGRLGLFLIANDD